jgi:prepilin-type processing-associated H-X9-DG protein
LGYTGDIGLLSQSSTAANAVDKRIPVLLCPETGSWYWRWGYGRCYGINMQITSGRPDLPTPSYADRRKISRVSSPSTTFLICDNYHYAPITFSYMNASARTMEESGNPDLRSSKHHNRKLVFVFCDGHAEVLKRYDRTDVRMKDRITNDSTYDGWY